MKILNAAICCSVLLCAPGAQARADEYAGLAKKLAGAALGLGVGRVAVLGFSPKGAASQEEADFIAERISSRLCSTGKVQVVERALIEKVLGERRLMVGLQPEGGWVSGLSGLLSADAAVSGTVYAEGDRVRVIAKLIDMKTGRLLGAVETEAGRDWTPRPGDGGQALALPDFYLPPPDLRDALAPELSGSCAERRSELRELNKRSVLVKAKYWAMKMNEPGFSYKSLTRNPGSELRDPATKVEFYRLLGVFCGSGAKPELNQEELRSLRTLLSKEAAMYGDCGVL